MIFREYYLLEIVETVLNVVPRMFTATVPSYQVQ